MMILDKRYDIYTDMLCSDMVLAGLNYGWYSRMVDYQATLTLLILVTTSLGGIIIELFCQVIKLLKLWR
jgi:hypothetical protein